MMVDVSRLRRWSSLFYFLRAAASRVSRSRASRLSLASRAHAGCHGDYLYSIEHYLYFATRHDWLRIDVSLYHFVML